MITGTIYQVIAIVKYQDGDESIRSHGFFDCLWRAEQIRDSVGERMHNELNDVEWRVILTEIKL